MRTLHIVMPLAGRGSRFANAGFTTPKPLIQVDEQAMFLKALSSFDPIQANKRYTLIIRQEHDEKYSLQKLLSSELPEANIVVTNETPTGATSDAVRAEPYLREDEGLVVMDCDFCFLSAPYYRLIEDSLRDQTDDVAALLTFESTDPRYSFAQVNSDGIVTRTAEKIAISDRAIWGAYYFARPSTFLSAARELMQQPLSSSLKEYYISPLYNIILGHGKLVRAAKVDSFSSFGTPEELDKFVGHHVEPS